MRRVLLSALASSVATIALFVLIAGDGREVRLRAGAPEAVAAQANSTQAQQDGGHAHHGGGGGEYDSTSTVPDPDAPPGADPAWLPGDRWVMSHWLPYPELLLHRILHSKRSMLQRHLLHEPLKTYVRARGLKLKRVVARLLRPAKRQYPGNIRELRKRAYKTFTQRHLMQHMLFHPFHGADFEGWVTDFFGIGWPKILPLRRQRKMSFLDIAEHQGIPRDRAQAALEDRIEWIAREAIRTRSSPRQEVGSWLIERRDRIVDLWGRGPKPLLNKYPQPAPADLGLD